MLDVVVRRLTVDDAPAVHEAILESLDHLRPWMPWAAGEPLRLDERVAWLRESTESSGIFVGEQFVGGCGLHARIGAGGREIGYWVRATWTGRGIATEAARQLIAGAAELVGVDHVEIHHDRANLASRRIPEKLGFTLVREVTDGISAPGEDGISCEWRLDLT